MQEQTNPTSPLAELHAALSDIELIMELLAKAEDEVVKQRQELEVAVERAKSSWEPAKLAASELGESLCSAYEYGDVEVAFNPEEKTIKVKRRVRGRDYMLLDLAKRAAAQGKHED